MNTESTTQASGSLGLKLNRGAQLGRADGGLDAASVMWPSWGEPGISIVREHGLPHRGLSEEVNEWRLRNMRNLWRGYRRAMLAQKLGISTFFGCLFLTLTRGDGTVIPYGLASLRVVTTAGVNKVVALLNTSDASTGTTFKFHGFGTGNTAEASGDTALVTEFTTQYAVDSTRPTGTQTTGGSSNVYRSVATFSPDSGGTLAVVEHGLFSASSAGTLFDRSVFAAVNTVAASDSITATYDGTFPAGG